MSIADPAGGASRAPVGHVRVVTVLVQQRRPRPMTTVVASGCSPSKLPPFGVGHAAVAVTVPASYSSLVMEVLVFAAGAVAAIKLKLK